MAAFILGYTPIILVLVYFRYLKYKAIPPISPPPPQETKT